MSSFEYECESEYDYELEREIENETRALAREDDEYEELARTCDEYYDAHSSERAPSEYSKECEDVAVSAGKLPSAEEMTAAFSWRL